MGQMLYLEIGEDAWQVCPPVADFIRKQSVEIGRLQAALDEIRHAKALGDDAVTMRQIAERALEQTVRER